MEDKFGGRVQRISIEGGFTCPNRDGSKGKGGCNYCNNESFAPIYARRGYELSKQIIEGKKSLKNRFEVNKYLAYFQSYSNTYADISDLRKLYESALAEPGIVGLSVSTRSDCISLDILDLLAELSEKVYVNLEIGIESIHDNSLKWMNRCHSMQETLDAFDLISNYSQFDVTGHLILGLPGETKEMMLDSTVLMNKLPLTFLKLHHLQVIENTRLATEYKKTKFPLLKYEEYLDLISDYLSKLRPGLVMQRLFSDAPKRYLIAPYWDKTSTNIIMDIQKYMRELDVWQGKEYNVETLFGGSQ